MFLIFLRHADAEDAASNDFERRLSPKGLEQAAKVGRFCANTGLIPDALLTSPLVRARQTADLVAEKLGDLPVQESHWLACGMTPELCFEKLRELDSAQTVMLVGHEPDFSASIAVLLGSPGGGHLHIRKACLAAVDVSSLSRGGGRLECLVPARLMIPLL